MPLYIGMLSMSIHVMSLTSFNCGKEHLVMGGCHMCGLFMPLDPCIWQPPITGITGMADAKWVTIHNRHATLPSQIPILFLGLKYMLWKKN